MEMEWKKSRKKNKSNVFGMVVSQFGRLEEGRRFADDGNDNTENAIKVEESV